MQILHRLTPRKKLLSDFYVFDTETGTRNKAGKVRWELQATPDRFIFGVIYGLNFTKVIHSVEEFITEFRDSRYRKKKVFAHNAGAYDLLVLYGGSCEAIFKLDPNAIFIGSKFICCTNGNCTFADSLNIFQTSLRKLGKMLGKKKGHLQKESMFVEGHPDYQKTINYCIQDCVILWEALFETFEFAGDIKITQASLAMTYFRRFHQNMSIEHNDNTRFFWESYFGGRTEVFKLGKTHSNVIDRNSMYPAEMQKNKFPNPKFLKVADMVSVKGFLTNILYQYEGVAQCTVEHAKTTFGYLPFKNDEEKLLFPVGTFTGFWNFPELRYAIKQGAVKIIKIQKIVYAPSMDSPFTSFVDTLYEARFKTDLDFEIYRIKIFMNSLYGKFAQRITEESIYISDIEKQFHVIRDYQQKNLFVELVMFNQERKDAFLIIKSAKSFNVPFAIPSFASYITSYARVSLLKKLYEMEKNVPVYCDTDSIFYEIESPGMVNEKFLGGWKKEEKIVTEIRGLKNYKYLKTLKHTKIVTEKHLIKGVPTSARKISDTEFEYFNLTKSKESLRRNITPGMLTKRTKKVRGVYDKRIVHADGTTEPFTLTE